MGIKRIIDRGETRGHRYLVMDGSKRAAVFDTEVEAKAFTLFENYQIPAKPKGKKSK